MRNRLGVLAVCAMATFAIGCGPMAPTLPAPDTTATSGSSKQPGAAGDTEYQDAVLSSQSLALEVPADQQLIQNPTGRIAHFYLVTYKISTSINRGIMRHLNLLEDIVDHPPTARYQNKRVWGPWTGTLSPVTYVFAVEKVGPGRYHYLLQGKPKGAPNSAYLKVFGGVIQRGLLPRRGAGTFVVDFDVARRLDPLSKDHGAAHVAYDNRGGQVKVVVNVKGALDSKGQPTEAHYEYFVAADGEGAFKFVYKDDIVPNKTGQSVQEIAAVHSRWLQGGAGRADAVVTGGDLSTTQVQFKECWNTTFHRTFYTDNKNIHPTEGNPGLCAF